MGKRVAVVGLGQGRVNERTNVEWRTVKNVETYQREREKKNCNKNKLYALPVAKERKKKKRSAYLTDQYKKSIEKECLEFIV